jgi:PKD repeat protein
MRIILFLTLFINFAFGVKGQNEVCRKSTEGTDFWFGFMESRNYQSDHYLEITVTAREATTFQIKIGPQEQPYGEVYSVEANRSKQVPIPWEMVEAIGSEEIEDKGIRLISEKPVNVYALNWNQNSADVAVIYPVGSLGTEYFAMCYYPDIDMTDPEKGNGRNSEFLIVATENATSVEITPSRVTHKLIPKDSTFIVVLNKGQVYQVQSENLPGTRQQGQGDLTGSHIKSNKPVAFYSGSLSTQIPTGKCCWDHLYEQIPPVHSWGLEYYLAPLKTRQQDRYRIMASQDNTHINITGRSSVVRNRGDFLELVANQNELIRVLADKPVMVAQYSQSVTVDQPQSTGDGDPFMIILSPVNQSRNDVTFVAYESPDLGLVGYTGITKYFVNVITADSETENIRLNGEPVENFIKFTEGSFSFAQVPVEAGTHHLQNINEKSGFLAYVYGFGGLESYGYGAGFNLDLTLDLGESVYFKNDTLLLCQGSTLLLDAGNWFDSYLWDNGETTHTREVTEEGWYHVETQTFDGCKLKDSVYVVVSRPNTSLDIEPLVECMPFELELSAGIGYEKYIWTDQTGKVFSESQTVVLNRTGTYRVTVTDKYNCQASDTKSLVIHPVPEITFSGPSQVCGKTTASLSVAHSGVNDSIWKFDGSYEWKTNSSSIRLSDLSHDFANITANEWGDFEIYYTQRTINNCERTDTFQIRFHPQPVNDFILESNLKCEGYNQELLFTGIATDSAIFHWDLHGRHFLDTLGREHYLISVGAYLSAPSSISLYIDDKGCLSETISRPVGVTSNFTMESSHRRGCDELTVDFTGKLLTQDAVEFMWDFGDGDTSSEAKDTKHFSKPGYYDISLTVTNTINGCINAFTIDSMIRVFPTPVAAISANPDICYPDTAQLLYIHNNDSSNVYWEFEGMHQVGSGNDSILVRIDNPIATVKIVVNEYGCISEPDVRTIKRKPKFDFLMESTEGCPPFFAEIFAESDDNNILYEWITDTSPTPSGSSMRFSTFMPGFYDAGLIAFSSETGCRDTLIKEEWIKIYPNPEANFRVNYSVAMIETANIQFTNRSRGAELYYWDFGDGAYSTLENPMHTYREPGEFVAQLVAESAFGCPDTFLVSISVLPSAVFTPNAFRPSSPIHENRTFMPVSTGVNPLYFILIVYNRQGQLVFESTSPSNPWDGSLPDGSPAGMGNYIWIARYTDVQGIQREQKGQVLLIR